MCLSVMCARRREVDEQKANLHPTGRHGQNRLVQTHFSVCTESRTETPLHKAQGDTSALGPGPASPARSGGGRSVSGQWRGDSRSSSSLGRAWCLASPTGTARERLELPTQALDLVQSRQRRKFVSLELAKVRACRALNPLCRQQCPWMC